MHPENYHISPNDIERQLYESEKFLDELFPQTIEDVQEMQEMFGSTSVELPEKLRDSKAIVARIIQKGEEANDGSAFGNLVSMLRMEKKWSIEQLAEKVDLDPDDLLDIESGQNPVASPLVVTVIADYFKLQRTKMMQLAGLIQESDGRLTESLSMAAYAKPNFDLLSSEEKKLFYALIKQLRKKG